MAREAATRLRALYRNDAASMPDESTASPHLNERSTTSAEQPSLIIPGQQDQTSTTPALPVLPRLERVSLRHSLQEKIRRANQRRFIAIREANLKEAAHRSVRASASSDADDGRNPSGNTQENLYALEDTMSRSDESQFDLIRRGPSVNPAYQAARDERYRQKIAEGYSHEQAMSISDASTQDSDDIGPLDAANTSRLDRSSSSAASRLINIPRPYSSMTLPAPSHQPPPPPRPFAATQLAPLRVPERWQPRVPEEVSVSDDPSGVREPTPEEVCLRLPPPTRRRDSTRLSQVRLAFTDTTDETTGASTEISDDPWRDEVRENKRLGR